MSNCPFCNLDPAPKPPTPNPRAGNQPTNLFRRAGKSSQWLFPTTLLIFMPKCPMCIAAYIALFTGITITASTARWIYILIPLLCLTSLAVLTTRYCLNRFMPRGPKTV